MIRRYIIWRNNHAYDERLRRIVGRANIARRGTGYLAGTLSLPRMRGGIGPSP